MTDEVVPDDLRNFILRYIDSVVQLEALLLLRGSPNDDWDVKQVAARLYTGDGEVAEVLARLCADGFLRGNNGLYQYGCQTAEQQSKVDLLAAVYSKHLIPVTAIIHAKPPRIREFADAFKFRKDS